MVETDEEVFGGERVREYRIKYRGEVIASSTEPLTKEFVERKARDAGVNKFKIEDSEGFKLTSDDFEDGGYAGSINLVPANTAKAF